MQARAVCLQAIHKFLLYGLVRPLGLCAGTAINECVACLAKSMSNPGLHRSHRELLHLRVLELFLELVRCPAGILLSNQSLCLVFEEIFALRRHAYASATLVAFADDILCQFILVVFVRLRTLKRQESANGARDAPALHRRSSTHDLVGVCNRNSYPSETTEVSLATPGYGTPALERILRFIAGLIDPSSNDLDVRILGLRLVNICLETAGGGLGLYPDLVAVVQDDICKQILQNSQTTDSSVLALVLRIVYDLFAAVRRHIRVQLEVRLLIVDLSSLRLSNCRPYRSSSRPFTFESLPILRLRSSSASSFCRASLKSAASRICLSVSIATTTVASRPPICSRTSSAC